MDSKIINQFPIRDYLAGSGIYPAKDNGYYGMYHSPFREDRDASFKVDYGQNLWYDHGIGEGGTIIDLVMKMENCSFHEAATKLEKEYDSFSFNGNAPTQSKLERQYEPDKTRIEILSVGELSHPALVGYLRDRNIDVAIARKYCNEIRYRIGDREYFAIGFKNDAGGWELRNRSFKGSSTPKNITTIRNDSNTVMVFEGFIDFLISH